MAAQGQQPPIYIGVFGGPRAGKTSFIREAVTKNNSRSNLAPTTDVQLIKPLTIDGRQVVLFDTPAFYNRAVRDLDGADVLKRLAGFLVRFQENGRRLSAIIFIHPHSNGPKTPWLTADSQRNLPIIRQLIGDGLLPNMIFALRGWSNPPTPDQISRDAQARAQEPFRTHVQRVNWSSGPSPRGALDIIRMAMKKQPRQLTIQQELIDRRLRLSDTAAGRIVAQNAKQIAQQLRSHGDNQGAQKAERVDGKLREGFQRELDRWPKKSNQPRGASAPRPASTSRPPASAAKIRAPAGRPAGASPPATKRPGPAAKAPAPAVQHPPRPTQPSHPSHPPRPHGTPQAPVRQYGPVATPPMAHRPGNTQHRNEVEMRQRQPAPQPAMQYSAPSVHQHITHIHAPPNPQPQLTPPPNVYNNTSYHSYSYQENAPIPPAQPRTPSPSHGGIVAGVGLVAGAGLGYAVYEGFKPDDNEEYVNYGETYVDPDMYVDDPDIYVDNDDTDLYLNDNDSDYYPDNNDPNTYLDDYDNDPSSYAAGTGYMPDNQTYEPDRGTSNMVDDSQFQSYNPDPEPRPAMFSGPSASYGEDKVGDGGGNDDTSECCGDCCECNDCCNCCGCCGGDDDDDKSCC